MKFLICFVLVTTVFLYTVHKIGWGDLDESEIVDGEVVAVEEVLMGDAQAVPLGGDEKHRHRKHVGEGIGAIVGDAALALEVRR